jgi:hypothetical protein
MNSKSSKPNLHNLSLYKTIISLISLKQIRFKRGKLFLLKLSLLPISLMIAVLGYNLSKISTCLSRSFFSDPRTLGHSRLSFFFGHITGEVT